MEILVIDDEIGLGQNLNRYLTSEGFKVSLAANLAEGRAAIERKPDLVVLDWTLPDGSGTELLREWRKNDVLTPVIMLTAKAELVDKVVGLELGANDYLTKPFEPRELLARIHVQLRSRHQMKFERNTSRKFGPEECLRISDVEMNTGTREVRYLGNLVTLTRMEFDLLRVFLASPGQVLSRTELLNEVWGYDNYPTTRTVDNHVSQLRKKISPPLFEIVHRVGYRFVPRSDKPL